MRQNGAMFICNRCRKRVFAERFDDGRFDQKALDGWALETRDFFGVGDLCPECFKVYRETMERFLYGRQTWNLKTPAAPAITMTLKAGSAITACHRKERRTQTQRTPASYTKREASAKANCLKMVVDGGVQSDGEKSHH